MLSTNSNNNIKILLGTFISMVMVVIVMGQGSQPYSARGTGMVSTTGCTKSSGTCSNTGSDAYYEVDLDYSKGIFYGTIKTNQCNSGKLNTMGVGEAKCTEQTFPDPSFTNLPSQMPLGGTLGITLKGVLVYSAFEAGFQSGFVCQGGSCVGGLDLSTCEASLNSTCANHKITNAFALPNTGSCNGHARPYHIHKDIVCDYDTSVKTKHSPLTAVMLDGHGLYGLYEDENGVPTDLDDCNGHYGPVPASAHNPAQQNVYHYHATSGFPFTIGCFGPLTETKTCKSLNSNVCGDNVTPASIPIWKNSQTQYIDYKLWCPCKSANPNALLSSETTPTKKPNSSPTKNPVSSPTTKKPSSAKKIRRTRTPSKIQW